MATKFHVQAVPRPGHDGSYRAGRKWPSGAPTPVEVLDQDEDPPHDPTKGVRIGKATYEILKKDPHLTVRAPGDPLTVAQDHAALVAENARLKEENARLKGGEGAKTVLSHEGGHREAASTEGVLSEDQAARKRR